MVDVLRIKRRAAGGAAGPPATLAAAEIAFNEQDRTLYYGLGNSGGVATSIIPIAGSGGFLPLAGGTLSGGLGFGSAVTGGANDLTRHISLYGGIYGISITGGRQNYVVAGGSHMFVDGTTDLANFNASAFSIYPKLAVNAAVVPQASLHVGTTAGTARVYNSYIDASNGEWAYLGDWLSNVARYGTDKNGTGVVGNVQILVGGVSQLDYGIGAAGRWSFASAITVNATVNPGINLVSAGVGAYINISAPAGFQSAINLNEAGVGRWQIGRQADNSFFMYDNTAAVSFLSVTAAGQITLGESTQLIIPKTGLVCFSGITSAFPALKRTGTTLEVRLADDSAYAMLRASSISISGLTSGSVILAVPAIASGTITLPSGTTNFTATGGAGQVVKQLTVGGPFTVATLGPSEAGLDPIAEVPVLLGTAAMAATVRGVCVMGNYAYTTNQSATGLIDVLEIFDITVPAAPVKVGGYILPNQALGQPVVAGNILYTGCNVATTGLQIIDVSNPKAPSLIRSFNAGAAVQYLALSGAYLYVGYSGANATLRIYDISDPAIPLQKGAFTTMPGASGTRTIVLQGKYAFVGTGQAVAGTGGLYIFDVGDPGNPNLIHTYDCITTVSGLCVAGKYLYLHSGTPTNGIEVINIEDPYLPVLVTNFPITGAPGVGGNPILAGNNLYILTNSTTVGLQVINVTNPAVPSPIGSVTTVAAAFSSALRGNCLYVTANAQLRIYDVLGLDVPAVRSGSINTDNIYVDGQSNFNGDIYAMRGMVVGQAGIFSRGPIFTDASEALIPISAVFGNGLVCVGENAATSPALKRSGTTLQIRLGDDSNYALASAFTPVAGDNSNLIATTAFVTAAINAYPGTFLSDTPPASPIVGDLWFDSTVGQLFIRFNDGTSTQWVVANNQPGPPGATGATGPQGLIGLQGPNWTVGTGLTLNTGTTPNTILVNSTYFNSNYLPLIGGVLSGGLGIKTTIAPLADLHVGTTAGTARIYNTYISSTAGEWAYMGSWLSNIVRYGTDQNGTGTARDVQIMRGGSAKIQLSSGTIYLYEQQVFFNNFVVGHQAIYFNNNTTGYQSLLTFQDVGVSLWQLGKQSDNSWVLYNATNSTYPVIVSTTGLMTLGQNSQIQIVPGGVVGFNGTTAGFPGLRRNGTALEVVLADNSGYTSLNVSFLAANLGILAGPVNISTACLNVWQTARNYNFYTNSTNSEWAYLGDWSSSVARYGTDSNGTGVIRDMQLLRGGVPKLFIEAAGVRVSDSTRFTVGNPTAITSTNLSTVFVAKDIVSLGTTIGAYQYPFEFQYTTTSNVVRLQIAGYRRAGTTGWQGSGYRIQYGVDNSFTDGTRAYVEIGTADVSGTGQVSIGTQGSDRLLITATGIVSTTGALQILGSTGATDNAVLNVDAVLGNTAAKFGPSLPVYLIASTPAVGFNTYYNAGWKYGEGSTTQFAGTIAYLATGETLFSSSTAGGAANAAVATIQSTFIINPNGVHAFGPGAAFTSAFPAIRRHSGTAQIDFINGDQTAFIDIFAAIGNFSTGNFSTKISVGMTGGTGNISVWQTARSYNVFTDASNCEWAYMGEWASNAVLYGTSQLGAASLSRDVIFMRAGTEVMRLNSSGLNLGATQQVLFQIPANKLFIDSVGSTTGEIALRTNSGGGLNDRLLVSNAGGIVIGAPTGGAKGVGTINAVQVYAANVLLTSDERQKRDIEELPDCLALVEKINPQQYRFRELDEQQMPSGFADRKHWGFIAQDVGRVMQEAGHEFGGHVIDDNSESLSYNDLIAVLWKAVQELAKRSK